jgi:NAD(P)-dependent dehydrogenase (short-subunit alcohol dehydrogenase family)
MPMNASPLRRLQGLHSQLTASLTLRAVAAAGAAATAAAAAAGVAAAAAAAGPPADAPLSAQRLDGKVCLVTGGSSGIGKAICVQLAREGASVVAFDLRRTPREGGSDVISLMLEARQSEGLPTKPDDVFVEGDVADAAAVQQAVETTLATFGQLDVLVNNAAKMNGHTLLETSEEEWDDIMSVNAKGTFLFSKAAVAQFLQQPRRGAKGAVFEAIVH